MTLDPRSRGTGDKDPGPSPATYAGVGIQFAIALVIFALGGNWMDQKLGSSPLFLLLGVFLGAAAAFYSMYRKLMGPHNRKDTR